MRTRKQPVPGQSPPGPLEGGALAVTFGVFLGVTLLKFGNPPIMEKWVTTPADIYEFLLGFPWPITWAYGMLLMVAALAVLTARQAKSAATPGPPQSRNWKRWLPWIPVAWLGWQTVAALASINAETTGPVVIHFAATVICFYLGFFGLSRIGLLDSFWAPVLVGFWFVLAAGWFQHFGGLEQTQKFFYLYIYPQLTEVPPEYLKKMTSTRIFGTLFYPNALAGAILLLLPPLVAWICGLRSLLTPGARALVAGGTAAGALACLVWSGSKGGWLILLLLLAFTVLRLPLGKRLRIAFICVVLVAGLTGFFWRYAGFFQRGATSVGARFDYWTAALKVTREHPLVGTGPGTFGTAYSRIKAPESEPARLTHNDYLQQASDSGVPGLLLYTAFIAGALLAGYPRSTARAGSGGPVTVDWRSPEEWRPFAVWLGVFGWSVQGLMEFGLYIPALSWPAFALLGWMVATGMGNESPRVEVRSSK